MNFLSLRNHCKSTIGYFHMHGHFQLVEGEMLKNTRVSVTF